LTQSDLTYPGGLVIPNGVVLQINQGGGLNVTGCVSLGGSLVINATNLNASQHQVTAITAECFVNNTEFQHVTVAGSHCQKISNVNQMVEDNSLVVVFQVSGDCHGFSMGAIVAIVIAILLSLMVAILAIVVPGFRKRVFPFWFKDREGRPNSPIELEVQD